MNARGFTLAELLVAAALVLVVAAVVGLLANAMRRSFDSSLATVDVTARARSALGAIGADVQSAGSGMTIGAALQRLRDVTPVVLPHRALDDLSAAGPFAAVTVTRATGNQGVLRNAAAAGSTLLEIDPAAPSTRQDGTAGFLRGERALIVDGARAETVVIADAGAWIVSLQAPVRNRFGAGAHIVGIERATYGLRDAGGGNTRLVRRTAAGAEQPVADHVVRFEVAVRGLAEPPRPAAIPEWFPTYGPMAPPIALDDDRDLWAAGENCAFAVDGAGLRVERLPQLAASGALVALTPSLLSDGPWCPDAVDGERFDADLLRLVRVDLQLEIAPLPDAYQLPVARIVVAATVALRES